MADLGNFRDLASVQGNTVEKPKPLPTAGYIARFTGPAKEHKSKQKGTLAARFPIKLAGCADDELQAQISGDESLTKALNRDYTVDFWLTADSLWRVTEFAKGQGIDTENLNLLEILEQLPTTEPFLIQGKQEPATDGSDNAFFRLDNPAPMAS